MQSYPRFYLQKVVAPVLPASPFAVKKPTPPPIYLLYKAYSPERQLDFFSGGSYGYANYELTETDLLNKGAIEITPEQAQEWETQLKKGLNSGLCLPPNGTTN